MFYWRKQFPYILYWQKSYRATLVFMPIKKTLTHRIGRVIECDVIPLKYFEFEKEIPEFFITDFLSADFEVTKENRELITEFLKFLLTI